MTSGPSTPDRTAGTEGDASRSSDTIGVKMFIALEDVTGVGPGPAIAPGEGASLARLHEECMRRRRPDAGEITKADVTAVLEEIAATHFGIEGAT